MGFWQVMTSSVPVVEQVRNVSFGRVLFISIFGPPIGILAYVATFFAIEWPSENWRDVIEMVFFVLLMGWPLGIFPAAIAALVWKLVPKPADQLATLGVAALVGAVVSPIVMGLVIKYLLQAEPMALQSALVFALAGAVAMVATAIPFSKPKVQRV